LPRALIEYLEDGDKEREWKSYHQRNQLYHQFYLFYALLSFLIMIAGAGVLYFTLIETVIPYLWIGSIMSALGFVGFLLCLVSHLRMIKRVHHNRRNER
jgi:hypothetical protein